MLGLLMGKYVPLFSIKQITFVLLTCFFLFLFLRFPSYQLAYRIQILTASLLCLTICATGILFMQYRLAEIPTDSLQSKQAKVLVEIEEPLQQHKKSTSILAKIIQWQESDTVLEKNGRIRIYFPLTINDSILTPNNWLLLNKTPQRIAAHTNTNFNYQQYAFAQGIYYQAYMKEKDFQLVKKQLPSMINSYLLRAKNFIIQLLDKYIKGEQEAAIAKALLIGYKKNMDRHLLDAYSKTGIIHIIAISGMHLGMIYLLLLKLLYPFRNKLHYALIEFTIVIIIIWLFTLLTGAAPSIVRAAIIFTCMSLGKLLKRKNNSLNALALAAICILIYNPLLMEDIGFQLSFAAVISIICFYIPIKNLVFVQNKILLLCWESVAITLAAQILTFPLLLYHFHQFPTIFLFTNFIAIPISGVVLYLELVLLITSSIPVLAMYIGKLIYLALSWLNNWVEAMAQLPFASITNISFTIPQTVALYIFIIILIKSTYFCASWKRKYNRP
jgi:competence protein ComEC